ncbi:MAG: hypothetical protein NT080_10020 [Spirochaetes bacterium]|nr:hypothetical protein [Spirochaetota bacterium]
MGHFGNFILAAAVAAAGCAGAGKAQYRVVGDAGELPGLSGERVRILGSVSELPWQHLIADLPGRTPYYFDIGTYQIVVYFPDEPAAGEKLYVYGTVLEVSGGGKSPSKSAERFTEYHVACDFWEVASIP